MVLLMNSPQVAVLVVEDEPLLLELLIELLRDLGVDVVAVDRADAGLIYLEGKCPVKSSGFFHVFVYDGLPTGRSSNMPTGKVHMPLLPFQFQTSQF